MSLITRGYGPHSRIITRGYGALKEYTDTFITYIFKRKALSIFKRKAVQTVFKENGIK